MKKFPILLLLLLSGCNEGQQFQKVHTSCEQTVPIQQLGACLEYGLNEFMPGWQSDEHAGYVNTYIAWLNAAGQHVIDGSMSESDMRYGASQLLSRMRAEANQNRQVDFSNSMAMFLSGLAIMNAGAGYAPQHPRTATFWTPGTAPISCTSSLNTVTCF